MSTKKRLLSQNSKRERQKRTVERMVKLYCARKHKPELRGGEPCKGEVCGQCAELLTYAHERLGRCKYGAAKPSCKNCTTHCYNPIMRSRMQAVMRYAGPRMLLRAPIATVRHLCFCG